MKKDYITPEMLIRRVVLENMIATSLDKVDDGTTKIFSDADAREGNEWGDVWED